MYHRINILCESIAFSRSDVSGAAAMSVNVGMALRLGSVAGGSSYAMQISSNVHEEKALVGVSSDMISLLIDCVLPTLRVLRRSSSLQMCSGALE